jgi:hypothetical protein
MDPRSSVRMWGWVLIISLAGWFALITYLGFKK